MEKQVEIVFSTRALRSLRVMSAPFKHEFSLGFRTALSRLVTKKAINNLFKKLPGVKGFRRLQIEVEKRKQCMVAFIDDSHPYITVIFCTHIFTNKKSSVSGEELEKAIRIVGKEYFEKGGA